ncbi:MAG: prepilin-type N-terminal cleavage/methylation domain-containing protein [Kiritimatiellales bacterium]
MKNKCAFTLIEILIVVAIIGIIAAIGVPLSLNAIKKSQDRAKEINVASVEAAKEQWALENSKTNGTAVVWGDISNYMSSTITSLSNLNVGGYAITINKIGTKASY